MEYTNGWVADDHTSAFYYDTLPTFCPVANNGKDIWLSKQLSDVTNDDCIGFFSFQQQVNMYLDGEEVYSFVPAPYVKSETPGNRWNFLPLDASANGKTLTIHIYQCYGEGKITIPTIYYGTQTGIMLNYLSKELPSTYLSIAMMFVGVLLLIFHMLKRNSILLGDSLKWLALFALFRGIWSYIEGNTYSFFVETRLLLVSHMSYMSLKTAVALYLHFLNENFHNGKNKFLRILTICSIGEFFLTFVHQFFGVADFADTVVITHALLLVAGVYTCADVVRTFLKLRKETKLFTVRKHYSYLMQLLATIIIVVFSIVDMVRYYTTNSPDIAQFSRIADIIYVTIMSLGIFLDFVYLLKMGQQAAIISEEASTDPMTKLGNRASFEKEIVRSSKKKHLSTRSIIMLDLNNLKQFNDQRGHDVGDSYIITASQIINEVFSPFGLVYRIGGDEFCVIAKNLTEGQFKVLCTSMDTQMRAQNLTRADDHTTSLQMAIASGYAAFDPSLDKDLHDTMKRADAEMYHKKEEQKSH
ncbi:MAG: GGDEF domain-containing protein [Lachnospiraceae bacterium]|nr:GGDEF domain-containing protein [Lachnospiraceae bacterium]